MIPIYQNGGVGYVSRGQITDHSDLLNKHKVFIPRAGSGSDSFPHTILGRPFYGEPGTASTETYLAIGPVNDQMEAESLISYIRTKFFRFMVLLSKNTQDATSRVYEFVPQQTWDREWTDDELYEMYGINDDEIAFIESMIRPME